MASQHPASSWSSIQSAEAKQPPPPQHQPLSLRAPSQQRRGFKKRGLRRQARSEIADLNAGCRLDQVLKAFSKMLFLESPSSGPIGPNNGPNKTLVIALVTSACRSSGITSDATFMRLRFANRSKRRRIGLTRSSRCCCHKFQLRRVMRCTYLALTRSYPRCTLMRLFLCASNHECQAP